ncbi:hypothetical protein Hanom_Chr16g01504311 [Helianthus anomalus]
MKESISLRLTPPSATDSLTSPPNFTALLRISSPSSEPISILTASATTLAFTNSFLRSQFFTSTPILRMSVIKNAFLG